jgi:hypothetical protein
MPHPSFNLIFGSSTAYTYNFYVTCISELVETLAALPWLHFLAIKTFLQQLQKPSSITDVDFFSFFFYNKSHFALKSGFHK